MIAKKSYSACKMRKYSDKYCKKNVMKPYEKCMKMLNPIKPLHVWNSERCKWFDETMKTPMGKIPFDVDGEREKVCLKNGGTFRAVPVYTNPFNYYIAGFECCRAGKAPKPKPTPRPSPFSRSPHVWDSKFC